MKFFITLIYCIFFLCKTGLSASIGQSLEVVSNNKAWDVFILSNALIKAYNPASQIELMIDLNNILPSSPYCVLNKHIKNIRFTVSIYKIANKGEKNWFKSFVKTKIYFYSQTKSEERKVYSPNLIKNNTCAKGGAINVGSLDFLAPITCNNIENIRMKIIGMKDKNQIIPALDYTIKIKN